MQEILARFTEVGVGILGVIFLFGFAVFIHELGHFLAAKWLGVGVSHFAIGFGPRMVARKWGETEYSIRWLPLGGFVSLKGMLGDGESEAAEEAEGAKTEAGGAEKKSVPNPIQEQKSITEDLDALRNKPTWAKIVVFGAGVTMNFITAVIIMVLLLWYGSPVPAPRPNVLEEVPPSSMVHEMGYRTGDRIVAVEGEPVEDWNELMLAAAEFEDAQLDAGASIYEIETPTLTVRRDGQTLRLPMPRPQPIPADGISGLLRPWFLPQKFEDYEPYAAFHPPTPAYITHVEPRSPAHEARLVAEGYRPGDPEPPLPLWEEMPGNALRTGDQVLAVNGQKVQSWREMEEILQANPGEPITLAIDREGQGLLLTTILERRDDDPSKGRLGVVGGLPPTSERDRLGLGEAMLKSVPATIALTGRLIELNYEFFADKIGSAAGREQIGKNLGGPVLIARMAYQKAQQGLAEYLNIFIIISIILAVMNLLPIPVLDGGYIVIALIEGIIRRPIPEKILVPILSTFMFLFMVFFVLIFYNDFRNL